MIKFLNSCLTDTVFLKSVDASNEVKDAKLLCDILDAVVMEVGMGNVVQVITVNAINGILANKMLQERHHTILLDSNQ
jgi:hypothetical protein